MRLVQASASLVLLAALLTACDKSSQQTSESSGKAPAEPSQLEQTKGYPAETIEPPQSLEERRELREQLAEQQAKELPEPVSEQPDETELPRGEVPDAIFDKIVNAMLADTGASRDEVTVRLSQSITYNDGSLGCGKPGQNYTMATVPGYRVILVYAGQQFDYRANEKGYFILCERPSLSSPDGDANPPVM